jgi:hypothetical protein
MKLPVDIKTGIYIGIGFGIADMLFTIVTKSLNLYWFFYQ